MSKYMQLTVRVRPYYKKGLKADYPAISRGLSYIDEALLEEGPSLFDIVGRLAKLLYDLDGNPPFDSSSRMELRRSGCFRRRRFTD